jgi:hypothetical protein
MQSHHGLGQHPSVPCAVKARALIGVGPPLLDLHSPATCVPSACRASLLQLDSG